MGPSKLARRIGAPASRRSSAAPNLMVGGPFRLPTCSYLTPGERAVLVPYPGPHVGRWGCSEPSPMKPPRPEGGAGRPHTARQYHLCPLRHPSVSVTSRPLSATAPSCPAMSARLCPPSATVSRPRHPSIP